MDMNEMEKLAELMKDQECVQQLKEAATMEEAQAVFAAKGVALSDEEMKEFLETCLKFAEADEELSEIQLENVAGGGIGTRLIKSQINAYLLGMKVAAWLQAQINKNNPLARKKKR